MMVSHTGLRGPDFVVFFEYGETSKQAEIKGAHLRSAKEQKYHLNCGNSMSFSVPFSGQKVKSLMYKKMNSI